MNYKDRYCRERLNEVTDERDYYLAQAYVYNLYVETLENILWCGPTSHPSLAMVDEGCPNWTEA